MPTEKVPIKYFQEDYLCDVCGEGFYRSTGISLMSNPPQYPHICNKCEDRKTFNCIYPRIMYEQQD